MAIIFVAYVVLEVVERRRRRKEWDSLEKLLRSGKYLSQLPSDFRKGRLNPEYRNQLLILLAPQLVQSWYQPVNNTILEDRWKGEARDEPVIGFRVWHTTEVGLRLRSAAIDYTWSAGVNHADCLTAGGTTNDRHFDIAPNSNCQCGLYVLSSAEEATNIAGAYPGDGLRRVVVGAVLGWGKVCQHGTYGWRAEYARPLALLGNSDPHSLTSRVGAHYGLTVVSNLEGLRLFAEEFGKSLPGQGARRKVDSETS